MNPTQINPSQPRTIQLRPDSPSLRQGAMAPGCPTRRNAGVGCSATFQAGQPVAVQPAPVPPRRHPVPEPAICWRAFWFGALLLALVMLAFIAGGAL